MENLNEELLAIKEELKEIKFLVNDLSVKADQNMTLIRPMIDKLEKNL